MVWKNVRHTYVNGVSINTDSFVQRMRGDLLVKTGTTFSYSFTFMQMDACLLILFFYVAPFEIYNPRQRFVA